MISQVVNKEMVAESYEKGIEFFIHKPINKVESRNSSSKNGRAISIKKFHSSYSSIVIKFRNTTYTKYKKNTRDYIQSILNDMGIIGEVGSEDMTKMIELLIMDNDHIAPFPL